MCRRIQASVYLTLLFGVVISISRNKNFDCGPYGFTCESASKLRLCEGNNLFGPTFLCPPNTVCSEDSSEVCENTHNYIDPSLSRTIRCHRNERIADPNVPDCKGYILCIPNKNRFQGIKFKCAGNTVFNGVTRTCSAPDTYKCPLAEKKHTLETDLYPIANRKSDDMDDDVIFPNVQQNHRRAIDCKHYKFSVTQEGPSKAAYFCPQRPVFAGRTTRCTVFSSNFCLTLEKLDEDQFAMSRGIAHRRPKQVNVP